MDCKKIFMDVVEKINNMPKKQKLIGAIALIALIVVIGVVIGLTASGTDPDAVTASVNDPVWENGTYSKQKEFFAQLNDEQRREFLLTLRFCTVNHLVFNNNGERNGKTYSEFLAAVRQDMGEENCRKLDEFLNNPGDEELRMIDEYVEDIDFRAYVTEQGKSILTEETGMTCVGILLRFWPRDTTDTNWYHAVAIFRDEDGDEIRQNYEVKAAIDRSSLYFFPEE